MAYEQAFGDICAQINATFEIRQLIKYCGGQPDKLVKSGEVFHAHCPIHGDDLFRTLVLNPRNNTYHCNHGNCPGSKPADFLDLIVRSKQKPLAQIIENLISEFGPDYFRLSQRQVEIVSIKSRESMSAATTNE